MLEIKVTVEAPALAEAIHALAGAIGKQGTSEPLMVEVPKSAKGKAKAKLEAEAAAPATSEPVTAPAASEPVTSPPASTPAPVPSYTLAVLSTAGAKLLDQGKLTDLMNLLKTFGVQAITQLKPEQYPAMAEGLRALGAQL